MNELTQPKVLTKDQCYVCSRLYKEHTPNDVRCCTFIDSIIKKVHVTDDNFDTYREIIRELHEVNKTRKRDVYDLQRLFAALLERDRAKIVNRKSKQEANAF